MDAVASATRNANRNAISNANHSVVTDNSSNNAHRGRSRRLRKPQPLLPVHRVSRRRAIMVKAAARDAPAAVAAAAAIASSRATVNQPQLPQNRRRTSSPRPE